MRRRSCGPALLLSFAGAVLLTSCATAELRTANEELSTEVERLEKELAEARSTITELENQRQNRNQSAEQRISSLESELEGIRTQLSTILELTGSDSPEAAVQEIEALLLEVESLRELAQDQAYARSLLRALQAASPERPEAAPPDRRVQPAPLEPGPLEEARGRVPGPLAQANRGAGAQSAAQAPPPSASLNPRVLAGFIQVEEIESTYIGETQPLPGDTRLSVTVRAPESPGTPGPAAARIYLPRSFAERETIMAPIVLDGAEPQLAVVIKVTYPTSEQPLYLRSIEVTGRSNAAQVALLEVRRRTNGSRRMEEALITDPATVRALVTLMIAEEPPQLAFHGNTRTVQKRAPQELRGNVAAIVYTLRALGGEM